jgi:hypothetical protein
MLEDAMAGLRDRVIEQIRPVLEADPRIAFALLFGSVARGEEHPASDLDLAVGLRAGTRLSSIELGDLVSRLEAVAGRTVDLLLLEDAPEAIAFRVFRDGVPVVVRDRRALVDRQVLAMLEYWDFQPIEEILVAGALRAARRGR